MRLAARALRGYIYEWNVRTGDLWFDGALFEITGFTVKEAISMGASWRSRIFPADRAEIARARSKAIAEHAESFSAEYRFAHRDGHYIWIWDHAVALRDQSGSLLQIVGAVLDVSDRKAAQLALRASERRYRAAVTATSDIQWTLDALGQMRGAQHSWQAFSGHTPEQYDGEGWANALHTDDVINTLTTWRAGVLSGTPVSMEFRARRHDGVYRHFSMHAVPVHDEHGQLVEWVCVSRDVTEERATTRALREATQRLQLALDAASIGMWDWDPATDHITWNRQCHVVTGLSENDFDGSSAAIARLLQPVDCKRLRALIHETQTSGRACGAEFQLHSGDGQPRWVALQASTVTDATGPAMRAVGTLIDITDRKKAESQQQALLEAERAARTSIESAAHLKDDFLSTISHELRTPLNAMLGWATLLQRPDMQPSAMAKGLQIIERNGKLQAQLINDLMDADRLMSGKFDFELQRLNLNDAVRAALDSLAPTFANKSVQLQLDLCDDGSLVDADFRRFQQVMVNLLSNAAKFSAAGGTVIVRTYREGSRSCVEVRDHGEGIAAEFLPFVFDRFRQAERGSARRHGGLGLGLAISKQIVGYFGGSLVAESAGVDQGATFRVTLPSASEASKATAASQHSAAAASPALQADCLGGVRVLVVDDEPEALDFITRLLREQGAEVLAVNGAAKALETIDQTIDAVNLLISDIGMSDLNGYTLLRALREQRKLSPTQLPAMALTAFARETDRRTALAEGFQDYLTKPFEATELIRRVYALTHPQSHLIGMTNR